MTPREAKIELYRIGLKHGAEIALDITGIEYERYTKKHIDAAIARHVERYSELCGDE